MEDRQEQLRSEHIGTLLLKFSIPAIVGMLVNALYNIVDRIFIGQGVNALAITGIGLVFPIMTVMMAFGMLIGIGSTALISIRLGEKRQDEAEHILGNAFTLLVIVSLAITVLGLIFIDPLLVIFGASPDTIGYAKDYIVIILYGAIFNALGFGLNNIIRAEGNPKAAMLTMLLGAIINTILDPIFIFVFNMGVKGAAYATIIGQLANTIYVLSYFNSKKSILKIHRKHMKPSKEIVMGIFAIGMSPFAMQLAASVVQLLSNNALKAHGGDLAIGAMSIISSAVMIFFMPIFGINQGAQPIIGYNYGAKQYDRVKHTLKLAVGAATMISLIGFITVQVFPQGIIRIFNNDPELIRIGSSGIRVYLAMMPIIGFQIVSANYFQAIGKAKISMFLSLLRQVTLLIPLLLILPPIFGLTGVWLSAPTADFISSIITGIFVWRDMRKLDEDHALVLALQK
ncbi:MATE family efflux transporter [Defluviitalea saccharophila]|uniref:Multidrug export protein MepA n=1 Tax=Defluviitalea saccharophila TaxID=879970 RepID=A0ABZ2YA81_9FIRM